MYPLKNWSSLKRGYRFKEKTWYSKYHLGLDLICKQGTPIYAPANGKVEKHWFKQGGNTIYFYWDNKILRVLHLFKFGKIGTVKKGDIIGYSGNSGTITSGPHVHIDISKNKINIYDINNFIDPETFNFTIISNDNTMFIKKINDGKIYIPVGNKLIHFNTSWKVFAENFENATIVEVNTKEFRKFEVVKNVSVKT